MFLKNHSGQEKWRLPQILSESFFMKIFWNKLKSIFISTHAKFEQHATHLVHLFCRFYMFLERGPKKVLKISIGKNVFLRY